MELSVGSTFNKARSVLCLTGICVVHLVGFEHAAAQSNYIKIDDSRPPLSGRLTDNDHFGSSVASIGDVDGDGVNDIAVGAIGEYQPNTVKANGSVWILFLLPDGNVREATKLVPTCTPCDDFGRGVAGMGDVNGDGVPDIAVMSRHELHLLLLQRDGSIAEWHFDRLLWTVKENIIQRGSVSGLGDPDQDGLVEIAVGNPQYWIDDDMNAFGGLEIVRIDSLGLMKRKYVGNPIGDQLVGDLTGASVAPIGDLDGDGVEDIAVGAPGGTRLAQEGKLFLLFMNPDGSVKRQETIHASNGGYLDTALSPNTRFGAAVSGYGVLSDGGAKTIAVGAPVAKANGAGTGSEGGTTGNVWLLYLNSEGQVVEQVRLLPALPQLVEELNGGDLFGASVASLTGFGDDDSDWLVVGSPGHHGSGHGRGAVWIVKEVTVPAPRIDTFEPEYGIVGLVLRSAVRDMTPLVDVKVFFRPGGYPLFFSVPLSQVPASEEDPALDPFTHSWEAIIPEFFLSERGLEYFMTVSNSAGKASRTPESGTKSYSHYLTEGISTLAPTGTAADGYRLVSFPIDPDEKKIQELLESSLGPYDPTRWRFFTLGNSGDPVEIDQGSWQVERGRAYWVLARNRNQVIRTGPGRSFAPNEVFKRRLRPGWNLIGTPFAFPVPAENLHLASGSPLDLLQYDGDWSGIEEVIEPFKGYALFSASGTDTLVVDPDVSARAAKSDTEGTSKSEKTDWSIRIRGTKGRSRDWFNYAAMDGASSRTWDESDKPEPPVIGDFLSIHFPHPEWDRSTDKFAADHRPPSDGDVWDIEMMSNSDGLVDLAFDHVDDVPADYDVRLTDELTDAVYDLRRKQRFKFGLYGRSSPRRLQLAVGNHQFFEMKGLSGGDEIGRFGLSVFPNPSRGPVTFVYDLVESGPVSIAVYDQLGRLVERVIQEDNAIAGRHAVAWSPGTLNGVTLASGVYLIHLQAGSRESNTTIALVH